MSLFLENQNQSLLWKLAQRIPSFENKSISEREVLFKKAMETVYLQQDLANRFLTKQELQKINQEVLSILFRTPTPSFQKEEPLSRRFEQKQFEYEQMNAKPTLPDAKELFKENEDGAIQNMDELIKQYQSQRTQDIEYLPPLKEDPLKKMQETIDLLQKKVLALEVKIETILLETTKNISDVQ